MKRGAAHAFRRASNARWGEAHAALPREGGRERPPLIGAYTPRQRESYRQGRAYLYFFPDGHTERALVRMADGDDFYSLLVSPLTGKVEVRAGRVELERDFDTHGQEGAR